MSHGAKAAASRRHSNVADLARRELEGLLVHRLQRAFARAGGRSRASRWARRCRPSTYGRRARGRSRARLSRGRGRCGAVGEVRNDCCRGCPSPAPRNRRAATPSSEQSNRHAGQRGEDELRGLDVREVGGPADERGVEDAERGRRTERRPRCRVVGAADADECSPSASVKLWTPLPHAVAAAPSTEHRNPGDGLVGGPSHGHRAIDDARIRDGGLRDVRPTVSVNTADRERKNPVPPGTAMMHWWPPRLGSPPSA